MITPLVALKKAINRPMAIPRKVIDVGTLKSDFVIFSVRL